jgi:ABC-type phosphate transport system ATPase subunit
MPLMALDSMSIAEIGSMMLSLMENESDYQTTHANHQSARCLNQNLFQAL